MKIVIKKIFISSFFILISLSLITCSVIKHLKKQDDSIASIEVSKDTLDNIIKEHVEPIYVKTFNGGKAFCDYIIVGSEKESEKINIYLWLFAQEYFMQDGKLIKGTGGDFASVLTLKQINNEYEFLNCDISRSLETDESLKIFPENIREKAEQNSAFDEASLSKIEKRAEAYFKVTANL